MTDSINIALLGNCTTEYIGEAIRNECKTHGIAANLYHAPFGQYNQEVLFPGSNLYTSVPELVILFLEGKLLFPEWYDYELLQSDRQKKK